MALVSKPNLYIWLRWTVFAVLMGGIVWAYVAAADTQRASQYLLNQLEARHLALTQETRADLTPDFTQSFSKPLKKLVPHRMDGVVQPLWPWLAAWMHGSDDLPGLLRATAWFRLGLTLGFLVLLGVTCARNFTLPAAILVTTVSGFYSFLPTVGQFTGAALFHVFFLLTWLACIFALQRNSLWIYGLIGVFGALAYLSEDRVLPLLLVFVFVSTLRALWGWILAHWAKGEGTTLWVRSNHVFGLILLGAGFFFIAGPRLAEAQQRFGNGLFSYVDQVRWLDNEAAAYFWIKEHPDAASLKGISSLERPSYQGYLQTHSCEALAARLLDGLGKIRAHFAPGDRVLATMLLLTLAGIIVAWIAAPKAGHAAQRLHSETAPTLLFVVLAAMIYIGITGWDWAVMDTHPLLLALIPPLILSLIWSCESLLRRTQKRGLDRKVLIGYKTALWFAVAYHGLGWMEYLHRVSSP